MAVLICKTNQEGDIISTCDEKCYDSPLDSCQCICDGMNHGVLLLQAIKNTIHWFLPKDGQDGLTVGDCVKICNHDWNTKSTPRPELHL